MFSLLIITAIAVNMETMKAYDVEPINDDGCSREVDVYTVQYPQFTFGSHDLTKTMNKRVKSFAMDAGEMSEAELMEPPQRPADCGPEAVVRNGKVETSCRPELNSGRFVSVQCHSTYSIGGEPEFADRASTYEIGDGEIRELSIDEWFRRKVDYEAVLTSAIRAAVAKRGKAKENADLDDVYYDIEAASIGHGVIHVTLEHATYGRAYENLDLPIAGELRAALRPDIVAAAER
jgi:hypothetical protein